MCEKKHHEKQTFSFGYLQALGVESVTFAKEKSINLKLTGSADFAKIEFENHLVSKMTPC